ncbi:MAG TPA: protein translocase subunit SecD [Candidatus Paceibacterota bacterium]|nr:protein translocase subunit SecD [Candidatus Paceibacterota bacterium]
MWKYRLGALAVLVLGGLLLWFVMTTDNPASRYAVRLGLDLAGGTELVYKADTSNISGDKQGALNSLRDVIDRRVNLFGVAEPLVQLEHSSVVSGTNEDRLLVDLPGVTDVKAAVDAIGKTPVLEFKLADNSTGTTTFASTGLTGEYLSSAELQFGSSGGSAFANTPTVVLHFNSDGAKLFEQITSQNVGRVLAIFLDGQPISTPVIQEAIPSGNATITGQFTPEEARDLVQNLNFGALPVPITLESSDTVGATLGTAAFHKGLVAGAVGFALVALFMILWYRLAGVVAVIALAVYVLLNIFIIKALPVTLTASGIAGFILSIGMAVDANVLIFERIKEELRRGVPTREAVRIGFHRAWPAIRDGHLTMIISAVILFWIGTSLVKGFALVFGFGVITSLFTATSVSRTMLLAIMPEDGKGVWRTLMSSGLRLK